MVNNFISNLSSDIASSQFKLQEGIILEVNNGNFIIKNNNTKESFILSNWQNFILSQINGINYIKYITTCVHSKYYVTDNELSNFYNWLISKNFILKVNYDVQNFENESIEVKNLFIEENKKTKYEIIVGLINNSKELIKKVNWQSKPIKIIAYSLIVISVFRISYISAMIAKPSIKKLYYSVRKSIIEKNKNRIAKSKEESHNLITKSTSIGGKSSNKSSKYYIFNKKIKDLEKKKAMCEIRRDEFYQQNNIESYSKEIQSINRISKEIGELKAQLEIK